MMEDETLEDFKEFFKDTVGYSKDDLKYDELPRDYYFYMGRVWKQKEMLSN